MSLCKEKQYTCASYAYPVFPQKFLIIPFVGVCVSQFSKACIKIFFFCVNKMQTKMYYDLAVTFTRQQKLCAKQKLILTCHVSSASCSAQMKNIIQACLTFSHVFGVKTSIFYVSCYRHKVLQIEYYQHMHQQHSIQLQNLR